MDSKTAILGPETVELIFSGSYKYKIFPALLWNWHDNGLSTFTLNLVSSDGSVHGSGSDNSGQFTISGALVNDDLRFIKQYTSQTKTWQWKYIGKRVPHSREKTLQFTGTWGPPRDAKRYGEFQFSTTDHSGSLGLPVKDAAENTADDIPECPAALASAILVASRKSSVIPAADILTLTYPFNP